MATRQIKMPRKDGSENETDEAPLQVCAEETGVTDRREGNPKQTFGQG
jgi:hypothetical protein